MTPSLELRAGGGSPRHKWSGFAFGCLIGALPLLTSGAASALGPLDAASADRLRIQEHLARVEKELRGRDVLGLAPVALDARERALDALHEYRLAGQFPRNTGHLGEQVPYFIDDDGRPCAVAYLMQRSGAAALAEEVRRRENTARVAEMRTELNPWLTANGLNAAEAALIQPSYCECSDVVNLVCGTVPADGGAAVATFQNECIARTCGGATDVRPGACRDDDAIEEVPCEVCSEESSGCRAGRRPASGGPVALLAAALGLLLQRRRRSR